MYTYSNVSELLYASFQKFQQPNISHYKMSRKTYIS